MIEDNQQFMLDNDFRQVFNSGVKPDGRNLEMDRLDTKQSAHS